MHWHSGAVGFVARIGRLRPLVVGCLLAWCLVVTPHVASADDSGDEAPKPAPRVGIEFGGIQVVLVSTHDKLYAYLAHAADNAPATDAAIAIVTADGSKLDMARQEDGLFVGPFNRTGHMRDAFMISVHTASGTSEQPAELAYDDLPVVRPEDKRHSLLIALTAGGLGATVILLAALCISGWWRRRSAKPVGTAGR